MLRATHPTKNERELEDYWRNYFPMLTKDYRVYNQMRISYIPM